MKLTPGAEFAPRELVALSGEKLRIPDPERVVHLQLRRFAGCPICSLHLRTFALRRDEIAARGVREVVVFHSPAQELEPHASQLPFDVIPDPERRLYAELGVESSPRALLDPRAYVSIARAVVLGTLAILRGDARPPAVLPQGGRLGLPGDFLIAPDGRIVACKYGEHADDQWSVDEMLARTQIS